MLRIRGDRQRGTLCPIVARFRTEWQDFSFTTHVQRQIYIYILYMYRSILHPLYRVSGFVEMLNQIAKSFCWLISYLSWRSVLIEISEYLRPVSLVSRLRKIFPRILSPSEEYRNGGFICACRFQLTIKMASYRPRLKSSSHSVEPFVPLRFYFANSKIKLCNFFYGKREARQIQIYVFTISR